MSGLDYVVGCAGDAVVSVGIDIDALVSGIVRVRYRDAGSESADRPDYYCDKNREVKDTDSTIDKRQPDSSVHCEHRNTFAAELCQLRNPIVAEVVTRVPFFLV